MIEEVNRHRTKLNEIRTLVDRLWRSSADPGRREHALPRRVIAAYLNEQAFVLELDERADQHEHEGDR